MAKSYIVLLFAALFVFSSAASSFRLPETVEFSDDFLASFGGGGGPRPSFSRPMAPISRPAPIARPSVPIVRPAQITRPNAPISRPTPIIRPNIPTPKPNIPAPKPNIPTPKPNVPAPKPNIPAPKPSIPAPKPNLPPQTKPTVPIQAKPAVPPQTKPAVSLQTKPNVPSQTTQTQVKPNPSPSSTQTNNGPKVNLNLPRANPDGIKLNTNVGVNNGQPNIQTSITKTSGKDSLTGAVGYNGQSVNGGVQYTRTNGGSSITAGAGFQDGKASANVGATQNIGSSTLSGRADFQAGSKPTTKLDLSTPLGNNGQLQTGVTLGGGNKPSAYVQGSNTVGSVTYTGGLNLNNGKVGVQGGLQTPIGNTGGTLSATAGFTPDAGANAQVQVKIPF